MRDTSVVLRAGARGREFAADNRSEPAHCRTGCFIGYVGECGDNEDHQRQRSLDVVVTRGPHGVGPLEAFAPEQLADSMTRTFSARSASIGRSASVRKKSRDGWSGYRAAARPVVLLPTFAPYFAAKAGMDALAVVSARELTRWGYRDLIVVPGAFTGGTNHFAHSGRPADTQRCR